MSRSSKTSSSSAKTGPPQAKRKLLLLLNPNTPATSAKALASAARVFRDADWRLSVATPPSAEAMARLARRAASSGAWACLVVGGDGTLNRVAAALAGTPCRLGLIPAGTGNGFARALGLPFDPRRACAQAAAGRVKAVDLIRLDKGRVIASVGGIGLDAEAALISESLRWLGRVSGFLRYLLASLLALPRARPAELALELDGQRLQGRFWMVVLANSPQFGLGVTVAPGARLEDGRMDVVTLEPCGLGEMLRNLARLLTARPLLRSRRFRVRRCTVTSLDGVPASLHVDGEPAGHTPVRAWVQPQALKVLVP